MKKCIRVFAPHILDCYDEIAEIIVFSSFSTDASSHFSRLASRSNRRKILLSSDGKEFGISLPCYVTFSLNISFPTPKISGGPIQP